MKLYKEIYQRLGGTGTPTAANLTLILIRICGEVTVAQLSSTGLFSGDRYLYRVLHGLSEDGLITKRSAGRLSNYGLTEKGEDKVKHELLPHPPSWGSFYKTGLQERHSFGICDCFYALLPYLEKGDIFQAEPKIPNAMFRPDIRLSYRAVGDFLVEEDTGSQRQAVIGQKGAMYASYLAFQIRCHQPITSFALVFHINDYSYQTDHIRAAYQKRVQLIRDALSPHLSPYWQLGFSTYVMPPHTMHLLPKLSHSGSHACPVTLLDGSHLYLPHGGIEDVTYDLSGIYRADRILRTGTKEPIRLTIAGSRESLTPWQMHTPGRNVEPCFEIWEECQ